MREILKLYSKSMRYVDVFVDNDIENMLTVEYGVKRENYGNYEWWELLKKCKRMMRFNGRFTDKILKVIDSEIPKIRQQVRYPMY